MIYLTLNLIDVNIISIFHIPFVRSHSCIYVTTFPFEQINFCL